MSQTALVKNILKKRVHPLVLALLLIIFFIPSVVAVTNFGQTLSSQYNNITHIADRTPKWSKSGNTRYNTGRPAGNSTSSAPSSQNPSYTPALSDSAASITTGPSASTL